MTTIVINRAPVDSVTGKLLVTTTTPTAAWPSLGGMTYHPTTGELAVIDAVPAASDPFVGGIRFTVLGAMYVTSTLPSPIYYVGGLPVSADGRLFMSSGAPVGSVGGWPIGSDGGVSGVGLSPQPIFFAPLTSSLVPTIAGNPTATFTRATTAYATGVAPTGNAVDGQVLILCNANEPRFHGARRISANNWSETYADGSPIPAATLLGYIAENAATNICLRSQEFDNGYWLKGNATAPNDATVPAPDGTLTADRYTDDAVNTFHVLQGAVLFTAAAYTGSIYAKAGTLTWMQLILYDSANRWANFNLVTGVVGNKAAGVTATITALPNGWFRCSVTNTMGATSGYITVASLPSDINAPTPSYAGTGQTMYLWGAQVETGSDPTSYIATTTVAVVRNVDSLSFQIVSNIDGALATTYAETYLTAAMPGAYQSILRWVQNSKSPQFYDIATKVLDIGASANFGTANSRVLGTINKNASAWGGATASVCLNGGAVATGAFTPYSNILNMEFAGPTIAMQGCLRNVKFYNVRIADADLRTMTT